MQKFRLAPWSRGVWFATIISFVMMGFIFLFSLGQKTPLTLNVVICLGPIFLAYLFAPQSYSIVENKIIIHRLMGNLVIHKAEVLSIAVLENYNEIDYRAMASGGLFGFFGVFVLKNGERATLYCSRLDHVAAIKTAHKNYVISPENPEKFCEILSMK